MEEKRKDVVKEAAERIERESEKILGVSGLLKLRQTTDDLVLDPGEVDGVAYILFDCAESIMQAVEVINPISGRAAEA